MSGRLVDAILVARDLQRRHVYFAERLKQHPQLETTCAFPCRGVRVFEADATANSPSLIDAAQAAAAEMRSLESYPIQVVHVPPDRANVVKAEDGEVKAPDRIMRSFLQRYPSRATIRLLANLNPCWTRFAISKELAHVIMGEGQGARATSIKQQLEMAKAIGMAPQPQMELSGEQFAWWVACELMLPFVDRRELLNRQKSGESTISIAQSYWVPKLIFDLFFETKYGAISNSIG